MYRVIKQTREEKIAMYMKQPKRQLAEMLANCNETIEAWLPIVNKVAAVNQQIVLLPISARGEGR